MSARAAVILAAGEGTRMRSPTPKVLHRVGGRTLIDHAIDAAEGAGCAPIVVVVGASGEAVRAHVAARLGPNALAVQDAPLGTGHAVLAARDALAGFAGDLVVTYADGVMPGEAIAPLFRLRAAGADIAVLGFAPETPGELGRLILGAGDALERIVEARDATADQLAIGACSTGVIAASARTMFELLAKVGRDNAKGEYYLPAIVGLARAAGLSVRVAFAPRDAFQAPNSQAELAAAEAAFQRRRRLELMDAGVTLTAPETVQLSWDTRIAAGAIVEPNVVFAAGVAVETGATIRSFSHLEGALVRAGAIVGPFARLRPGADIGEDAHIGNFVEVKKVAVGRGAKANHLAYLGDGVVGAGANIGAGTIFCNYDGFDKHETHVGDGAFIGSNTALVAPVRVAAGAYTGSGSVITRDVEADALALARAPQVDKPGWARAFRARKLKERAAKA
ncbi:MAG TPA: bifunctional UDP-N-acetylglucosamine diphosphorylase/glucosamine-1-phosphate N-acetyltransferase GlmU [Caulobacteraceae bacterium]|nr:bifunctional UDP-N-acetylglucosamine diphosphorylase/glucosamine-1-phosphate N-acetyltransferase GlmU [Caulobacteraceae bacterium]